MNWLPGLVARIRSTIHRKLLFAFLVMVLLLFATAAAGLRSLGEANRRAEELVQLQRKISAYRQLNHDTIEQLYSVASALIAADEDLLASTLRRLKQFGYDLDRLEFVSQDEVEAMAHVREDYERFIQLVARSLELIRAKRTDEVRQIQLTQARPLADRLERLTNALVNKAESAMVGSIDVNSTESRISRQILLALGVSSVLLALLFGYAISWSIITPVREMQQRMQEIAAGDFSKHVDCVNRDELGALAGNVNSMNDRLGQLYRQLESQRQEIEAKNERLEVVSRHKSEFLSNMSHELRTPLNAIIGFAETLNDGLFGALNDKQAEYARDIHAAGQHLLSLINDILDLSKVEAGRMELLVESFHLPAAIDNAVILVHERANRQGVALEVRVDVRLNSFSGDERKFKQVLLNLLANAIKFSPAGGQVTLDAKAIRGGVQVSISDTGIGIAPEHQQKIFEAFEQAGASDALQREGTGLGLALARRFVKMHAGEISVNSELGRGAIFTFTMLAQPSRHQPPQLPV